jgi:hypothetical protein
MWFAMDKKTKKQRQQQAKHTSIAKPEDQWLPLSSFALTGSFLRSKTCCKTATPHKNMHADYQRRSQNEVSASDECALEDSFSSRF